MKRTYKIILPSSSLLPVGWAKAGPRDFSVLEIDGIKNAGTTTEKNPIRIKEDVELHMTFKSEKEEVGNEPLRNINLLSSGW